MTTPTNDERVREIRERHLRVDCYKSQMRADIDFLLSLLDSQAAGDDRTTHAMNTNERELTPLQAAMIEHDKDMARLDRNTLPDQFEFWLNNYWPDWRRGDQDYVDLMRASWLAALRLVRFNNLALKGAIDYTIELETKVSDAATRLEAAKSARGEAFKDAIEIVRKQAWTTTHDRMVAELEAAARRAAGGEGDG